MKHAAQITALAFAAISLAACAHPPPPLPVVDLAGMQCSQAVRLDDATPLVLDKDGEKRETALLDGHAHCIDEPSGYRSLYRVFALPAMAPSIITVSALPWGETMLPPRATFLDASGKTVMPGIVDSHSHIGIDGNPTVSDGQDGNEGSDPLEPADRKSVV